MYVQIKSCTYVCVPVFSHDSVNNVSHFIFDPKQLKGPLLCLFLQEEGESGLTLQLLMETENLVWTGMCDQTETRQISATDG